MPIMDGETKPGANQTLENQNSASSTETEMPQWAIDLNKNVDELTGHVRSLQGDKDKGIANVQKQLDSQADTFAQALEYGKKYEDPVEARRNWFVDQQIAQQTQTPPAGSDGAQENNPLAGQSSDAVIVDPDLLKTLDVDPTSAEYLNQVSLGKVGYEAAMSVLAARNTQQNPDGSSTGVSGGTGTSGPSETQQQVLRDQYNQELDATQKASGGVLQPLALYQIQEKYSKQGLEGLGYK